MKSKLAQIIFSTRLMAVLFIVFAVAMAVGTFLDMGAETSPTPYSRALVYNTWWFEAIMGLFLVNFAGNIFRYKLLRKEKLATLLLHVAFVFIILGAFITRYIGYEGVMPIREGASNDKILSEKVYLTAYIDGDYEVNGTPQRRALSRELMLSEKLSNDFVIASDYNKTPVEIKYVNYIDDAVNELVEHPEGKRYIKLVEASGGTRHDHYIEEGTIENIHNILFAFNKPTNGAVNISDVDPENPTLSSPFHGTVMRMADQQKTAVIKDSIQPLKFRSLYDLGETQFVLPEPVIRGQYEIVKMKAEDKGTKQVQDALVLEISANNETKNITLLGGKGSVNPMKSINVGGLEFHLNYGSKEIQLPFSIQLNDFIADKFPGNMKAFKAFKSKVTVNDGDTSFDYDIYMNNILDYKGYKFFQAQFDPDEKGTILSVNHDFWGTWISYLGYGLLFAAMLAIIFLKNTRFSDLTKQLQKVKDKKNLLAVLLMFGATASFSQEHTKLEKSKVDSILHERAFSTEAAAKFGALVIQDFGGRMKPLNTYSSELLRKLSEKDSYEGLDANQVFLSMTQNSRLWFDVPIIKLKRGNDSIRKLLGVATDVKYVALSDFFDTKGQHKISDAQLEEATKAFNPNKFQKDITKLYQQEQLFSEALMGSVLKIFPVPNDLNNKWVSYPELGEVDYGSDEMNTNIRNLLPAYISSLMKGKETGDYSSADKLLEGFKILQKKYNADIMPSDSKIKAELLYNKSNIFKNLEYSYFVFGIVLFIFLITQIFADNKVIRGVVFTLKGFVVLCFILHTVGLIARWYISGHAPWSDAYESIIYVSWATMLFGLIFGKKSDLTLAATAFVTAMLLWVSNLSFIDPAIGNLQPVLDSYWLMIHVAIIVASYGPFTLGAILGIVTLMLMVFTSEKNKVKLDLNIKELTIINEMALTVGLVMLTIGNFLGGMWANESWGRYWGWDPKETWALISIMVYAFVIHMRLVPGLRGRWFFNWIAILSFGSILFTYFGVNFYLVGLHSYASGDKSVSNDSIMIAFVVWLILGAVSYWKYKTYYKK
ncbi:MAG: cytochrome c biogenesis protein CcsA [Flavobacteriaceae bacterium]